MLNPSDILKKFWGYEQFRPLQEDIIQSIINGKDTLALLPTGGGKSICFQVPALMKPGLCLVVTPLIALMKDQVANLQKRNIPAAAIYAGMYYQDVERLLEDARRGKYKFLYVSPERLQSKRFLEYCDGMPVNLLAIDEAHCISQWGYDFRPAYLDIAAIRGYFPGVPVLALTASATPEVQQDICEKLLMKRAAIFTKSFARSNLSYSVIEEDNKPEKLKHILQRVPGSAIVYCRNRKRTREIADMLEQEGISATYYHAGLTGDERTARQELWINSRIRVIACTNAFGMGIDKPDVRLVVHYDATDALEAYYQEAGRAGRDEKKAYAVLLYQQQELNEMVQAMQLQFPEIPEIREVYQSLVNYLQVAVGSAEGVYYDFDINDFVRKFNLNITITYSALRILEQEGILQLSESVFMPSRVEFVISKQTLYDFTDMQADFEPITQTLLRTYEGVFDTPVPVYEKQLARILRKPEPQIVQWLQQLHQRGIIKYNQRKEEPQLCFSQERVSAQRLQIDAGKIKERMQAYKARLDAMMNYVENREVCRTQLLVRYFGEKNTAECGTCDVCIEKRKKPLEAKAGATIASQLIAQLGNEPEEWHVVRNRLLAIEEDALLEVMQFLILEEKAGRDADGKVYLR
ncbi:RecQ family ATP-dependent DNA helicase [Chitinophaga pinensis]|uniref:ATP-dependent DNA helicase RecQ n=1 Tax=Chitinophaga pinensis (strain ATCC 43595 / DSM 2588 / LMG 13176 / NBRC 15968 / NCIMB 11800 / UQM 2034) TaxID=485918 RepID=A0A979GTP5_CHIPD|nr:ATP-dependent DNA helicase RecQ [Chitinophaga pinensis]ACU58760.1 ATP-dependent DNA helicase, RecQ family [Chitinophaga pinensis DSM 2588]